MKINYYVFWIGLRYFFARSKNNFSSFIAIISMLGIGLGVAVLITVLSVMNGFSKEIRAKILSVNPHITLRSFQGELHDWRAIELSLGQIPEVIGVAPYIAQHGLLASNGSNKPVMVIGIDLLKVNHIYPLKDNLIDGSIENLVNNKFQLLINKDLADILGVKVNDQIALIIPQINISPIGVSPKIKKLTVGGILKSGAPYDHNQIFLSIQDADLLYKMRNGITGIQLKVKDELRAHELSTKIAAIFNYNYFLSDWTIEFRTFFEAMKMEKTVMTCILLLIIAVAAFNLVSSLIMLVTDKRSDIAILRVMGATRKDVILILILQGLFIGLIGTLIGLIFGVILALNVTNLVDWLQGIIGIKFVAEEAYFIGFLPSKIEIKDIIWVVMSSLFMSFIATLYPAYRASNIKPAEALRYE